MILAVRIGLVYLISGLGGSVLSALFFRSEISVGASGALFGLLGGMLSELLTNWTIYTNKVVHWVALNRTVFLSFNCLLSMWLGSVILHLQILVCSWQH